MKEHRDFVVAVIIALFVPVLFGFIYLYKMETSVGANSYIAKLESRRELLFFGESNLENIKKEVVKDENYRSSSHADFEVNYASGPIEDSTFAIVLRDVELGAKVPLDSVTWRLCTIDENGEVNPLTSGTFEEMGNQLIIGNFSISLYESRRYRLYYYFNKEVKNNKFFAKVTVE